MNNKKIITFDIETTGLEPWYGARITCICAKDSNNQTFKYSDENERTIIRKFYIWLDKHSPNDYFLLTKNGKMFDVPFILARSVILKNYNSLLLKYQHFDLHKVTKKWVSLESMADLFCVKNKTSNGEEAIKMWNEGRIDDLINYCYQDCIITEKIYLIHKRLCDGKTRG